MSRPEYILSCEAKLPEPEWTSFRDRETFLRLLSPGRVIYRSGWGGPGWRFEADQEFELPLPSPTTVRQLLVIGAAEALQRRLLRLADLLIKELENEPQEV